MKKFTVLTLALALAPVLFVDVAFSAAPSATCNFKLKNSTGGRIRVCEYNNDDHTFAFHDKLLSDGSSAQFNCNTSTCQVRVQWYWENFFRHGADVCINGLDELFASGDTSVLSDCNDVNVIWNAGEDRNTDDAVRLETWSR